MKKTKIIDGQILKEFRKQYGFSQRELAKSLNPPVTQGTISGYETGKFKSPWKINVSELEDLVKNVTKDIESGTRKRSPKIAKTVGKCELKGEVTVTCDVSKDSLINLLINRMYELIKSKDYKNLDKLSNLYSVLVNNSKF